MKWGIVLGILLFSSSLVAGQQPAGPVEALDGVDTVILLKEGKEVFGKQAFRSEHGRFAYLFSSADTKAEFDRAPEKYAIQMGGLCARMAKTATGNPSDYLVHDGKIYIFGSDACRKAFASAPEKYLPKPAAPMPRDPEAVRRGHDLLDRAVANIGVKLDAAATFVESSTETQQRQSGEVRIPVKKLWQFPAAARSERTVTMQNGQTVTFGTLMNRQGAWGIGASRATAVIQEAVPSIQLDLGRPLVPLLRLRKEPGTLVAATGTAVVEGAKVETVRVQRGGLDVTLNIDAVTGRVHSTRFTDRNRDGQVGEYTLVYADFRQVDGLMLPFEEKALFNGVPDAFLTRRIDSMSMNATLDAAIFEAAR